MQLREMERLVITPSPDHEFVEDGEIILIGDERAEKEFELKFC